MHDVRRTRRHPEAALPATDVRGIGRAMRAAAGGRMIVPRPEGRKVDLQPDRAAQAFGLRGRGFFGVGVCSVGIRGIGG